MGGSSSKVSAVGSVEQTTYSDSNCTINASDWREFALECVKDDPLKWLGFGKRSQKATCNGTHGWVVDYKGTETCDNAPVDRWSFELNKCVENYEPPGYSKSYSMMRLVPAEPPAPTQAPPAPYDYHRLIIHMFVIPLCFSVGISLVCCAVCVFMRYRSRRLQRAREEALVANLRSRDVVSAEYVMQLLPQQKPVQFVGVPTHPYGQAQLDGHGVSADYNDTHHVQQQPTCSA